MLQDKTYLLITGKDLLLKFSPAMSTSPVTLDTIYIGETGTYLFKPSSNINKIGIEKKYISSLHISPNNVQKEKEYTSYYATFFYQNNFYELYANNQRIHFKDFLSTYQN